MPNVENFLERLEAAAGFKDHVGAPPAGELGHVRGQRSGANVKRQNARILASDGEFLHGQVGDDHLSCAGSQSRERHHNADGSRAYDDRGAPGLI